MGKVSRKIYALIQKERDSMKEKWSDYSVEQWQEKSIRDKQCRELQAKIVKNFPDDFPEKGVQ